MAHNWLPFMKVMKLEPYGYKDIGNISRISAYNQGFRSLCC